MCLNCGYTYADESGFCSEYCENDFANAQPVEDETEEDQ
jgi:hypothetical protein